MKHINKLLFLIFGTIILLTACNKNDDFDRIAEEQARQDSIENARRKKLIEEQAPLLKAYVEDPQNEFNNPVLDTTTGIWFEVLQPGQQDSYTYKLGANGLIAPNIEVKYKGQLLNGTVFDETDETSTNETLKISLAQVILAWQFAFLPQSIDHNGQSFPVNGLSQHGLKKESKIRFVTPSPWGYDTDARDKIPANSPLVFEIEVVDIGDSM
ncbi:FKBP-type peptidyl-prolyl cis-trans isomerase [Olivibacter sp. SDN3]|uniref:FKBP-type peptidyl-prolyl cis-trans isomerase n=1 Tax=Olivibacter sp. SDN3 TaxID=2764720 RepID=UPI0016514499|nr:FKBP-type peptidyl-prolyl cis-trans isomerase [Olivibacter sp. SDN3]QNL49384.1 FKBP-type peptidyl-prolyl cis-trans isomerase [Olivibacter sp. SDN3]